MTIRYYIGEDTDLPHIFSHGVRKDEIEDVLSRGKIIPGRMVQKSHWGKLEAAGI